MCDCKVAWVVDPDVENSTVNLMPVTCSEYVRQLELALASADSAGLERVQRAVGILSGRKETG